MQLLTVSGCWAKAGGVSVTHALTIGKKVVGLNLCSTIYMRHRIVISKFSIRCSVRKSRKYGKPRKDIDLLVDEGLSDKNNDPVDGSPSTVENAQDSDASCTRYSVAISSRSAVLQACIVTSGLMVALGAIIRQASHVASMEGLPVFDCTKEVSFGFETQHLELVTGLVILISSCRYLLLKSWPDFAESSEAANRQVLTLLEPLDYVIIAFLPGISEELLFRGALLPLTGINLTSILLVAALFGVLHLGSGRKYSFAVWATFVGFAYGYATMISSSIIVPMASHALNNLVCGVLWRYRKSSSSQ